MNPCSIPGCARPARARGWCVRHWKRWRRHGHPLAGAAFRPDPPLAERYERRGPAECWPWCSTVNPRTGYGAYKKVPAHRAVYEALVGPIPAGLHLDHLCGVCICVNPAHLEPVTQAENNRRSASPSARNALKTHCLRGHPFDGTNTGTDYRGDRYCRACKAEQQRRRRALRRTAQCPF